MTKGPRIIDFLERAARLYANRSAIIVAGGHHLTYRQLHRRTLLIAAAFRALDVERGDRVAVIAENGLPFFDVYLACCFLGAIAVPINNRSTPSEMVYLLSDAEPGLIVTDEPNVNRVASVRSDIPTLVSKGDWYTDMPKLFPENEMSSCSHADDVALIIYTSGTTGRPKGACLTQRALASNSVVLALGQRTSHEDVFMSMTPLHHAGAGVRVYACLLDGQTHVVLRDYDTESVLAAIERYRITTTIAVPTQLRRILNSRDVASRDLSSLRLLVYGAGPTDFDLVRAAIERLPCGLYQGYGLSEATSAVAGLTPEDHLSWKGSESRLRSCGRPLPTINVSVRDSSAEEARVGEVGEIWVRGENVMEGYWRNPEATKSTLVDGWLRTGDLAYEDEQGYLYIVGRSKEMLITGGINVYPNEIEEVLCSHPAVAEAAVVGEPDPEWGERPVAYLILDQERELKPEALEKWCRLHLADFKIPTRFQIVEDLPRTPSGKVRKSLLRAGGEGAPSMDSVIDESHLLDYGRSGEK